MLMVRRSGVTTRLFCACLALSPPAYAQNGETVPGRVEIDYDAVRQTRVITAVRIDEPIALDGRLDEPAWKTAVAGTGFFQKFPSNGAPATEPTEFRVLYD